MGFGVFLFWSLGLLLIDAARHTLPNILTFPAAALALGACVAHPAWTWGLVWPAAYLFVGRGIGGGDVKLAVTLGVVAAAAAGLGGVILAYGVSALLSVLFALVMRRGVIAHGPSMILATWLLLAACGLSRC